MCVRRQATCRAHPNQRKVYGAVLGKLLPHLLAAGFGEGISPGAALPAAARQLLADVVFHSSHIEGTRRNPGAFVSGHHLSPSTDDALRLSRPTTSRTLGPKTSSRAVLPAIITPLITRASGAHTPSTD